MTGNEEKKEYLKGYERAVKQMRRSELRIRELRQGRIMPAAARDGMPRAANTSDLSDYAAMLDQEEREYKRYRYARLKLCREITGKIEKLQDEDEKDVLFLRYIKLLKWEEICDEIGVSWRKVHYLHGAALGHFEL